MKSGVMSMASSSSVPSRSYIRPENFVGMGPRGLSSFFLNGFFLSFGGAGGPKSLLPRVAARPVAAAEPPRAAEAAAGTRAAEAAAPPPLNPPPPPLKPPGRGAP